jgi:hypothetical protein
MKAPNIKPQATRKHQIPSYNSPGAKIAHLEFGIWSFSEVWNLEFGAF